MTLRELEELYSGFLAGDSGRVAALIGADPDGVKLAALLVVKLRFERLMRGSEEADRDFDSDPAGFTRRFEEYVREVPPTAFFPAAEAQLYREWLARRG